MKILGVGVAVLLATAGLGYFIAKQAETPVTEVKRAGQVRVDFYAMTLTDLAGAPQALSQWQGKVLVLNYWATWCPPCRDEMPAFSHIHERYAAKGVQFVGVSIDQLEKVREFQKQTPVAYPLLMAPMDALEVTAGLGNATQGLPFTVILDRKGEVAATKLGRFSESALEAELKRLL